MILPPRIAPAQIVILPVTPKPETRDAVLAAVEKLAAELRAQTFAGEPIRVEVDKRDIGGGTKSWEWIKKGVPMRVEIGPRDLEKGQRRRGAARSRAEGKGVSADGGFRRRRPRNSCRRSRTRCSRAPRRYRDEHTVKIDSKEEFYAFFTPKNASKPEIHGGFALAHWNGSREVEERSKEDLKVTIRCIPAMRERKQGTCIFTGEPSRAGWSGRNPTKPPGTGKRVPKKKAARLSLTRP